MQEESDNEIRRKLLSLQFLTDDADVDKIYGYVAKKKKQIEIRRLLNGLVILLLFVGGFYVWHSSYHSQSTIFEKGVKRKIQIADFKHKNTRVISQAIDRRITIDSSEINPQSQMSEIKKIRSQFSWQSRQRFSDKISNVHDLSEHTLKSDFDNNRIQLITDSIPVNLTRLSKPGGELVTVAMYPVTTPLNPVEKQKKLRLMTGVSFDQQRKHAGISMLAELRIGKRWSIQSGLKWIQIAGRHYQDAEQFDEQTGENFQENYGVGFVSNAELTNIRQKYAIVCIPVTTGYHLNIGKGWGVYTGLGTDLNLHRSQQINFEKRSSGDTEQMEHKSIVGGPVLNSLIVTIGLEKHWGKLSIRTTPTISKSLIGGAMESKLLQPGARLQVMYQIR